MVMVSWASDPSDHTRISVTPGPFDGHDRPPRDLFCPDLFPNSLILILLGRRIVCFRMADHPLRETNRI